MFGDPEEDLLSTTYPNRGENTLLGASEPDSPWTNFGGIVKGLSSAATAVGSAVNAYGKPPQPENVRAQDPNYRLGGASGFSLNGILGSTGGIIALAVVAAAALFFLLRRK